MKNAEINETKGMSIEETGGGACEKNKYGWVITYLWVSRVIIQGNYGSPWHI